MPSTPPDYSDGYKYSINKFPGNGVQTQWELNFAGGYITKSHVRVTVTTAAGVVSSPTFTWVGPNTIGITPAVATGSTIAAYRDTPKDTPLANFGDGSVISERNLDNNAKQAVFIAAEAIDTAAGSTAALQKRVTAVEIGLPASLATAQGAASLAEYFAAQALAAGVGNFNDVAVPRAKNLSALGLSVNDDTAGTSNHALVETGNPAALTAGRGLYLPQGNWYFRGDAGNGTGLRVRPAIGQTAVLSGEGQASQVLRSSSPVQMPNGSAAVWLLGRNGSSFDIHDISFDGGWGRVPEDPGIVLPGAAANSAYEYATAEAFHQVEISSDTGATWTRLPTKDWYRENRLYFTSGGPYVPTVGMTLTNAVNGAMADIATIPAAEIHLDSGSWAAGTAAGWIDVSIRGNTPMVAGSVNIGSNLDVFTAVGPSVRWARVPYVDLTGKLVRGRNAWKNEQSSTIRTNTVLSSDVLKRITVRNVNFKNRIGDDFKMAVPCDYYQASGIFSEDSPLLPRGSWQMSKPGRIASHVTDIICTSIESEPGGLVGTEYLSLAQAYIRAVLDIAGNVAVGSSERFAFVGTNIRHMGDPDAHPTPITNFYQADIMLANSTISRARRFESSLVRLTQVDVRFGSIADPRRRTEIQPVSLFYTIGFAGEMGTAMTGCRFIQLPNEVPITKGALFSTAYNRTDDLAPTSFVDCKTVGFTGEYVYYSGGGGFIEMRGGRLSASKAVIGINGAGGATRVDACLSDMGDWRGCLVSVPFSAAGAVVVNMSGAFDEDKAQAIYETVPITHPATTVFAVTLTALVNSDPNGRVRGIPGMTAQLKGTTTRWRYAPTAPNRCSETIWTAI